MSEKSAPVLLHIDDLSHDGRGIARRDGKVCFVAGALAGEDVQACLVQRHRRHDEYALVQVAVPAAQRVTPPCPIADRCGGCDLQHLDPAAQLAHKTRSVLDVLQRRAAAVPDTVEAPLTSPDLGYRRRARLAWQVPKRGAPVLGFRGAGSRAVVAVPACPVLMAPLAALPGRLQPLLARLRRPAAVGHVELAVSEGPEGGYDPLIHLHMVVPLDAEDRTALAAFAEDVGAYLSVGIPDATPELVHQPRAAAPGYRLPDFGLRLTFGPGDFLQGNAAVNRALVSRVADWLEPLPRGPLVDAFCGLGNFSLPLARRGFPVTGMEGSAAQVGRARANAHGNGIAGASFLQRDLSAGLPRTREGFEVAVLDPPRTGAAALVEDLAAARVATVVYVSCEPQTLARDAALLIHQGYRLEQLCLADMFPQTSHVETVAMFRR